MLGHGFGTLDLLPLVASPAFWRIAGLHLMDTDTVEVIVGFLGVADVVLVLEIDDPSLFHGEVLPFETDVALVLGIRVPTPSVGVFRILVGALVDRHILHLRVFQKRR